MQPQGDVMLSHQNDWQHLLQEVIQAMALNVHEQNPRIIRNVKYKPQAQVRNAVVLLSSRIHGPSIYQYIMANRIHESPKTPK
jgi:hypothetical protein